MNKIYLSAIFLAAMGGVAAATPTFMSGSSDNCAVAGSNGQLYCWGTSAYGALGNNGVTGDTNVPQAVVGATGISSLSVGFDGGCYIKSGTSYCWGHGGNGLIGNGSLSDQYEPVAVGVPRDANGNNLVTNVTVTAISVGSTHACELLNGTYEGTALTGMLACWGANSRGELGLGLNNNNIYMFPTISVTSTVVAVAAGDQFTCEIRSGEMFCFGDDTYNELGDGLPHTAEPGCYDYPAGSTGGACRNEEGNGVSLTGGFSSSISSGLLHTCAIVGTPGASGSLYCWGYNQNGELGQGNTTQYLSPKLVTITAGNGLTGVSKIALGAYDTYVLETNTAGSTGMQGWGANTNGEVGNGTLVQQTSPSYTISNVDIISSGGCYYSHTYSEFIRGKKETVPAEFGCTGSNSSGRIGQVWPTVSQELNFTQVTPANPTGATW